MVRPVKTTTKRAAGSRERQPNSTVLPTSGKAVPLPIVDEGSKPGAVKV